LEDHQVMVVVMAAQDFQIQLQDHQLQEQVVAVAEVIQE
jgi:hypothetical protein|tara:strand:+ start:350 stop:466 length:117 start_codon:yes stop_codon:yes gene_type:complete